MCGGWGCRKKDRSCSAVSRGFLLKDRKKRLFCLKVLVCCYQACNVLQLLIGTINVTASTTPCFSFLSSLLCSKILRLQPETQLGKQGHVPPSVTPPVPKRGREPILGAVTGVQRRLNDGLCPAPTASPVPISCVQPRDRDASNLSQMPNEPQEKKQKRKEQQRNLTQRYSSKNLFFPTSLRNHHFCFLPREDYLGMNLRRFHRSTWEKFAAAEEQKERCHTLAFGLWPNRNLDTRGKIYCRVPALKICSLLRSRGEPRDVLGGAPHFSDEVKEGGGWKLCLSSPWESAARNHVSQQHCGFTAELTTPCTHSAFSPLSNQVYLQRGRGL